VADKQEPAMQSEREQVLSLIGRYAKEFANLARERGCTSLSYLLQLAAEQAEKDLIKPRGSGDGVVGESYNSGKELER
jgi:hypothetical protein